MRLHMALVGLVAVGALATVNAQALGDHICAREGQTCNCRNGFVRYGSGTTYTAPYAAPANGSVLCSNSVFGDPLPNVRKECRCNGTGIYGVTVNVFPSSAADWATRPACGSTYNDQCCQCTLSGARLCANSTGCNGNTNGGTGAGYTCQSCPCKNPGIGCMLPRCTSLQYQVETAPNECTQIGNLNFYAKGACSSSYNASLQANATCPVPAAYVGNHQYPGTSTSTYTNYCNYFASPACAPRFCTSTFSRYCSQQCAAMGTTGPNAAFNVTQSLSPAIRTAAPSHGGVRPPPPPPGPPAPSSACVTTAGGLCFTDGLSYYANNERCTITVTRAVNLSVIQFATEANRDFLTIGRTRYSGTRGPATGTILNAGTTIHWSSDGQNRSAGFLICTYVPDTPPPPSTGSGEASFFTSSTCSESSKVSVNALSVTNRESQCQYAPFQDSGLYPITTLCGKPSTALPYYYCHGSPTCSGNGVCNVTSQQCECYQGYGGSNCSQIACPYNCAGYNSNSTPRGTCMPADSAHTQPWCQCSDAYTGTSCGGTARTIAEYVNISYTYRGFAALLQASPSTMRLLNDTSANYTLFAPSNTAISNVPASVVRYLQSNPTALTELLNYHIVQNLPPASITSSGSHNTFSGSSWPLSLSTSDETVFTLTSASANSGCAVTTITTTSGVHQCITDGNGTYSSNANCSWSVSASVSLNAVGGFSTQTNQDILTIGSRTFSGRTGPYYTYAPSGTTITFTSNGYRNFQGFVVCAMTAPTDTEITTSSNQVVQAQYCSPGQYYCDRPLRNGYIRSVDSVMIPQQVLALLPTTAPTSRAPTLAPTSYPTGVCTVTCDTTSSYCGLGNVCVCLPGYQAYNSTSCTYVVTTATSTTPLNQNTLLAAIRQATDIDCGDVVMGNTTGETNVLGNAGGDDFYRFEVTSATPLPVQITTCDPYTTFDTYLHVYEQAQSSNGQFQVRQIAANDDVGRGHCNSGSHGQASNLTLTLSPGVYYIMVEGYADRSGAYALHVQCIGSGTQTAALKCIQTRQQSNGQPIGPVVWQYSTCCLPGATCSQQRTCPGTNVCNPYNGCLPASCRCGTSSTPSSVTSDCNADYCMNSSRYGICGAPLTAPPTPAPTQRTCPTNTPNCDMTTTYCGIVSNSETCICRTGFVPPSGSGSYTSCNPMPTTTSTTTTTTTFGTAAALNQAYQMATITRCGHNYSSASTNVSIIGRTGGDRFFRLYVTSRDSQPVTLTTCNPATTFDTVLTVYQQTQDAVTQQYRFTRVAYNDDAYPRCTLGTGLASSVTQTLTPGAYLINVEGYSTNSQGNFTLAVECGPDFGPTPPPSPAPPAPLACTRANAGAPWRYATCSIYSTSTPCPTGSDCTRVVSSTACIPVSCDCNYDGSVIDSSCDSTCLTRSSYGVCLPATPAPTTPAPTYTPCAPAQVGPANCDIATTSCAIVGGQPTCVCLPGFVTVPGGSSTHTCVPAPSTTTPAASVFTTPSTINDPSVWAGAFAATCERKVHILSSNPSANLATMYFKTVVDENTPQPITVEVCGSEAVAAQGFALYMLQTNGSTDVLQLFDAAQAGDASQPGDVTTGTCSLLSSTGATIAGTNMTLTMELGYGDYYVPIPSDFFQGQGGGYTYEVLCDAAHVTNGASTNNGGKGFNSLSAGDQHTVIVAIVSIIVIGGVIGAAVFFVRRHERQQSYTAAQLVRDMDVDVSGDDDALLSLDNNVQSTYEDDFDANRNWKQESYGN